MLNSFRKAIKSFFSWGKKTPEDYLDEATDWKEVGKYYLSSVYKEELIYAGVPFYELPKELIDYEQYKEILRRFKNDNR